MAYWLSDFALLDIVWKPRDYKIQYCHFSWPSTTFSLAHSYPFSPISLPPQYDNMDQSVLTVWSPSTIPLHWRHNDHDGVSNHQPHGCLLNRLFGRRSKKTSKLHVTGLCAGNSPGPVNSPHKGPVTRKMFPFHDVIMILDNLFCLIYIITYNSYTCIIIRFCFVVHCMNIQRSEKVMLSLL